MVALVLHLLFLELLRPMLVVVVVFVLQERLVLAVWVAVAMAVQTQQETALLALPTRAGVAVAHLLALLVQVVQAVAVSSFSAIQTHSEPQQAQQVHQRLLWLEVLGSTDSQPLVLLRSDHGHH
jgi:hypothetical protein